MPSLQTIRGLRWLARLVLAWFVLSIGVAVASPLVNPQAMELICSGSGAIKVLVKTDDGAKELPSHTLDCPLCAHVGAPPPVSQAHVPVVHPLAHALRLVPAAHVAARTAAPLPPRGPPTLS
ncbi:DUF2946 family protein [Acidovorax radicis]|uniref:DUF2946 family protein n=1 Tax=Acidovorax radicis TaxID=758826 RepID=UPI001CF8B694|nr:DUF2946 family protein [Acidovorax radicis]UCU98811.1 DUF2946 domain-containing protein [Acidovorax radicis]